MFSVEVSGSSKTLRRMGMKGYALTDINTFSSKSMMARNVTLEQSRFLKTTLSIGGALKSGSVLFLLLNNLASPKGRRSCWYSRDPYECVGNQ